MDSPRKRQNIDKISKHTKICKWKLLVVWALHIIYKMACLQTLASSWSTISFVFPEVSVAAWNAVSLHIWINLQGYPPCTSRHIVTLVDLASISWHQLIEKHSTDSLWYVCWVFGDLNILFIFSLQCIVSWEVYYACTILSFFYPIHWYPLCGGGKCISVIVKWL